MPHLLSVNVGRPEQISVRRGRPLMSAIGKAPVEGRVRVAGVNVDGDDQADRRVHGGPDKAVYAYATEDTAFWEGELGRELAPGAFGENLTTEGLDVSGAVVGERWRIGTVELEVCQPRLPCNKLALRMGEPLMVKRFAQASRPAPICASRSSCSAHHCASSRAYAYTALSGPPWTRRSACASPATLTPSTRTRP